MEVHQRWARGGSSRAELMAELERVGFDKVRADMFACFA